MIRLIYFDANFIYNVIDCEYSENEMAEFNDYVKDKKAKLYYTPITFYEILGRITSWNTHKFQRHISALSQIKSYCSDNILDYPDFALAQIIGVPTRSKNNTSALNHLRDALLLYTLNDQLVESEEFKYCDELIKGWRLKRSKWKEKISDYIKAVIPNHDKRKRRGKITRITSKQSREDLLNELSGHQFGQVCLDATLCRLTGLSDKALIGEPKQEVVGKAMRKLAAYFSAYRTIFRKIINNGYSVPENDFDDVHYLVY